MVLDHRFVLHCTRGRDPALLHGAPICPVDESLVAVVESAVPDNNLCGIGANKVGLRAGRLEAGRPHDVNAYAASTVKLAVVYEYVALVGVVVAEIELVPSTSQP
jgi:hypothetical protein